MRRLLISALVATLTIPTLIGGPALAVDDGSTLKPVSGDPASLASFEGRVIDLSLGWGDAKACSTDGRTTQCFASEKEMDAAIGNPTQRPQLVTSGFRAGARRSCSSAMRLYDGISYTGIVIQIFTNNALLNMSSYAFDNKMTSFKMGSCSASFFDDAWAGGTQYPGSTGAWAQSASMATGWNNRIGSLVV